jgi:hypothetical protein
VVIIHNGSVIRSNIIAFTNEEEVVNVATMEALNGLSLWCVDNSYGNYCIYGQNNNLLNDTKANEILMLEARFADASALAEQFSTDAVAVPL